jgi:hypothetical protein
MAEEEVPEGHQQVQIVSSKDQSVTAAKANNKGLQEKNNTTSNKKLHPLVFPRKYGCKTGQI